jgi:hypothetical protein
VRLETLEIFVDKSEKAARQSFEKGSAAIEQDFSSGLEKTREVNVKLIEMARQSAEATFELAHEIAMAKTPTDLGQALTTHANSLDVGVSRAVLQQAIRISSTCAGRHRFLALLRAGWHFAIFGRDRVESGHDAKWWIRSKMTKATPQLAKLLLRKIAAEPRSADRPSLPYSHRGVIISRGGQCDGVMSPK